MRKLKWLFGGVAILVLALLGFIAWFALWPIRSIPPLEHVDNYVWLDQGWGTGQSAALRDAYYYTAQGTSIPQGASAGALRYDWFVHLEQPFSQARFAAPENMRKWRFIVDPQPGPTNPDQLPVGFTKHLDPMSGEQLLDITCAACHTGEIQFTKDGKTTAIRIDGGPAMHAFTDMSRGSFALSLVTSMINTWLNPSKFDRFAKNVLGADYPAAKPQLKHAVRGAVGALLSAGQNNPLRGLYPVKEGFGRTDALGRIGNTLFGDHLTSSNYQDGDAPVSYPYLWNIWKFDWVQYNGSVAQPLARNVGQALGVGARTPLLDENDEPLPASERFRSTVDIAGLLRIEHGLQRLTPPQWPEEILGAIDRDKAAKGAVLFQQRCQECHGPHVTEAARQQASAPLKPSPELEWRIEVIDQHHIGTDPAAAHGFKSRRYDLSATGLQATDLIAALRPPRIRALARDVRFRLHEVVRLRSEQSLPAGELPALLANYPDPDATAVPSLPTDTFVQLQAALATLLQPRPAIPNAQRKPYDKPGCALDCHTEFLLWDLEHGVTYMDAEIAALDVTQLNEGIALNLVGILVKNQFYAQHNIDYATQQCLEGFGALDLPQVIDGYKARPLEGVWATAPFLHNGSVPSLYQMLLPPAKRDEKFFVGRREFDPVHVGYVTSPVAGDDSGFWLDTSEPGNTNVGHAFSNDPKDNGVIGPELSEDERLSLVEYLKIHRDLPATPAGYEPPQCAVPSPTS